MRTNRKQLTEAQAMRMLQENIDWDKVDKKTGWAIRMFLKFGTMIGISTYLMLQLIGTAIDQHDDLQDRYNQEATEIAADDPYEGVSESRKRRNPLSESNISRIIRDVLFA